MDTSINQINQFSSFVGNFRIFIGSQLQFESELTKSHFIEAFDQFLVIVREKWTADPGVDFLVVFRLVLDSNPAFKAIYDAAVVEYEKEQSQPDEMEQTVTAITSFSESSQPEIPFAPVFVFQRQTNNVHVVVDGLNFWCRLLHFLVGQTKSLNFMDADRVVQQHQFDSEIEIRRAFDATVKFFKDAVPPGSTVHFVVKRFGQGQIWQAFNRLFREFFVENTMVNHTNRLYCALPENDHDDECDDRLVNRLALDLQCDENNRVYVISNDYYRSIDMHCHLPSTYKELTNQHEIFAQEIGRPSFPADQLGEINYTGFHFDIRPLLGEAVPFMKLDEPICI